MSDPKERMTNGDGGRTPPNQARETACDSALCATHEMQRNAMEQWLSEIELNKSPKWMLDPRLHLKSHTLVFKNENGHERSLDKFEFLVFTLVNLMLFLVRQELKTNGTITGNKENEYEDKEKVRVAFEKAKPEMTVNPFDYIMPAYVMIDREANTNKAHWNVATVNAFFNELMVKTNGQIGIELNNLIKVMHSTALMVINNIAEDA